MDKFQGFISIPTAFFEQFPKSTKSKISFLFFDEMIIQWRDDGRIYEIIDIVSEQEEWDKNTKIDIKRRVVPVTQYIPDYNLFERGTIWKSDISGLIDTVRSVVIDDIKTTFPKADESDYGFIREVSLVGSGYIDIFNLWFRLNAKIGCAFVPDNIEIRILSELFSSELKKQPFELFSKYIEYKLPDIGSLSMDEIVELRNAEYFNHFRKKMVEIKKILGEESLDNAFDLIEEIKVTDMVELIETVRPNPKKTVIKGFSSMFPIPWPINPFDVIFTGQEIHQELDIMKKYGWLYFIIDNL